MTTLDAGPSGPATTPPSAPATDLATFLAGAGTLTHADRLLLVDQALILLGENYVHLPLKVAMHAVNPLQRLRVLRARIERQDDTTMGAEWLFHREMSTIFHSVRDLHTNYLLPAPFSTRFAFLPFVVERCTDQGTDRYLVTSLAAGFSAPGFERGVEVTHWGGVPVARAATLHGAVFAGSNDEASLSRGVESMTMRPLKIQLPPDETWVDVTFVRLDGTPAEIRLPWRVGVTPPPPTDADAPTADAAALGLDIDADEKARIRTLLFRPDILALDAEALDAPVAAAATDVATTMPATFRARAVTTPSGTFGPLRLVSFNPKEGVDAFTTEFVRLLAGLPQEGLILDVRGNGGGLILAAEFSLQNLTPRAIAPEPVQFISTPLNTRLCRAHRDDQFALGPWYPSLDQATEIGAPYSAAFPITPTAGANAVGQTYHGPVVLVTDARCYSATDIFSAGFQDHGIGPVLGVDSTTGAGGANVWTQELLSRLLADPSPGEAPSPYRTLPGGAGMRVAIRRSLRVGERAGTPVEDLGVQSDVRHPLTSTDLLQDNVDLLAAAGELLAAMPRRRLTATCRGHADGSVIVDVETLAIERLDVLADGRPRASVDITDGSSSVYVPEASGASAVRVEGFSGGALVAARTVALP